MPGVDVAYRHNQKNHAPPQDGRTTKPPAITTTTLSHRNRGLCSVPRAYQWIDYSHGVAFWLQSLELRAWKHKLVPQRQKNNDDVEKNKASSSSSSRQQERPGSAGMDDQEEEEEEWMEVASLTSGATIVQAIERVQYALANDPPPELGDGSHILHVLLEDIATPQRETPTGTTTAATPTTTTTQFDSPKTGFELCVVLQERRGDVDDEDGATILQSPRTIPTSTPRRVVVPYQQPNVYGILHVSVSATMAGSESDYLPEVYRPLYDDLSLRNPTYEQFRERRRRQQQLQGQGQRGKGSGEL
jgi:hypothetical protein